MRQVLASSKGLIAAGGFFLTAWPVLTGQAGPFDPQVMLTFFTTWAILVALVVASAPKGASSPDPKRGE